MFDFFLCGIIYTLYYFVIEQKQKKIIITITRGCKVGYYNIRTKYSDYYIR